MKHASDRDQSASIISKTRSLKALSTLPMLETFMSAYRIMH